MSNIAASQWRAAALAVFHAQERYFELLRVSEEAPADDWTDRAVDLAWLALWRAERQRDELLKRPPDS